MSPLEKAEHFYRDCIWTQDLPIIIIINVDYDLHTSICSKYTDTMMDHDDSTLGTSEKRRDLDVRS